MSEKIDQVVTVGAKPALAAGGAMSAGGGMWAWLAENYQAIGSTCAILGVIISFLGLWMARRGNKRRQEHYRRIEEQLGIAAKTDEES